MNRISSYQVQNMTSEKNLMDRFDHLSGHSLPRSSIKSSIKSSTKSSSHSSENSYKNSYENSSNKSTIKSSMNLSSNHSYHNSLNRLLFFASLLLIFLDDVNCNSPPKIMPFHFNPTNVHEGDKALASK